MILEQIAIISSFSKQLQNFKICGKKNAKFLLSGRISKIQVFGKNCKHFIIFENLTVLDNFLLLLI